MNAAAQQEQALRARPARTPFRDSHDLQPVELELVEYGHRFGELAFAAVHEQYVRHWHLAFFHAGISSSQGFCHRRIVVTRGCRLQVESPIVALGRAGGIEHDTGRDSRFTRSVADVEAFEPLRHVFEPERFRQSRELLSHRGIAGHL